MQRVVTDEEILDAQLAFEEELLVGMAVDVLNGLINDSELTQREVARRLGVTEGRVSQILSGSQNLSLKKLAALGWALGVRFEVVPAALTDRRGTPAIDDPKPPAWLDTFRANLLRQGPRGAEAVAAD